MYRPPPNALQLFSPPPIMQYQIDVSKDWQAQNASPEIVADAIVQYYSSSISQFINKSRQNKSLGSVEQTRTQATFPGLTIDHITNQKLETIRITVYPEFFNPLLLPLQFEFNLDGYVALVFSFSAARFGLPPVSYDLLVNGVVALTYQPLNSSMSEFTPTRGGLTTGASVAVIIAFGPTALRAQSLHDKFNAFLSQKIGVTSKCLPSRAPIKASIGHNGGPIPQHDDLLGYFFFGPAQQVALSDIYLGWGDPFNPDDYAYDGDFGSPNLIWSSGNGWDASGLNPNVRLAAIVQFADAKSSPLVATGKNVFQVRPNPTSLAAGALALQAAGIASANAAISLGTSGETNYAIDAAAALSAATSMDSAVTDSTIHSAYEAEVACPTTVDKTNPSQCITAENLQNTAYNELTTAIAWAQDLAVLYASTNPPLSAQYAAAAGYAVTAAAKAQAAAVDAENASNYENGVTQLAFWESQTTDQLESAWAIEGANEGQTNVMLTEFYDRASFRVATSSWSNPSAPGGIVVNDGPLYWDCYHDPSVTLDVANGLEFDLTPAKTYPTASKLGQGPLPASKIETALTGKPMELFKSRMTFLDGVWDFGPFSGG